MEIRPATPDDVAAIVRIQNARLATTPTEWTDEPHSVEGRAAWLARQDEAGLPVLVATVDGVVIGFASYGDFRDSERWPGYRLTVEHTIHVDEAHHGGGVGRALMHALAEAARARGKHVMVAAVDSENEGSIRFHERLGFVEVGRLPEVGTRFGRWLHLVLLQLRLDDHPPPPSEVRPSPHGEPMR